MTNSEKSRLLFLRAAILRAPAKVKTLLKMAEKEDASERYKSILANLNSYEINELISYLTTKN